MILNNIMCDIETDIIMDYDFDIYNNSLKLHLMKEDNTVHYIVLKDISAIHYIGNNSPCLNEYGSIKEIASVDFTDEKKFKLTSKSSYDKWIENIEIYYNCIIELWAEDLLICAKELIIDGRTYNLKEC